MIVQRAQENWERTKINRNPNDRFIHNPLHSYASGTINDYVYRSEQLRTIMGETCFNTFNFDGFIFQKFICPVVRVRFIYVFT